MTPEMWDRLMNWGVPAIALFIILYTFGRWGVPLIINLIDKRMVEKDQQHQEAMKILEQQYTSRMADREKHYQETMTTMADNFKASINNLIQNDQLRTERLLTHADGNRDLLVTMLSKLENINDRLPPYIGGKQHHHSEEPTK